ncbi:MAG: hypothetical protein V4699_03315 [Patescibacteria group bacterium]
MAISTTFIIIDDGVPLVKNLARQRVHIVPSALPSGFFNQCLLRFEAAPLQSGDNHRLPPSHFKGGRIGALKTVGDESASFGRAMDSKGVKMTLDICGKIKTRHRLLWPGVICWIKEELVCINRLADACGSIFCRLAAMRSAPRLPAGHCSCFAEMQTMIAMLREIEGSIETIAREIARQTKRGE